RRILERRTIERLATRKSTAIKIEGLPRDNVRSQIDRHAVKNSRNTVVNINGRSGASQNHVFYGPSSQNRVGERISPANRDFISYYSGKRVANIKVGRSAVQVSGHAVIRWQLNRTRRAIVNRVRPAVRPEQL